MELCAYLTNPVNGLCVTAHLSPASPQISLPGGSASLCVSFGVFVHAGFTQKYSLGFTYLTMDVFDSDPQPRKVHVPT